MKSICRPVAATCDWKQPTRSPEALRTLVELNTGGIVAYRKADGSNVGPTTKGGMVHARENHVASDSAIGTDRCTMPSDRR
jgi:hypothetical protein